MDKANLITAHFDNVRNNQIGVTDGISPDVAEDLGFDTPEMLADAYYGRTVSPTEVSVGGIDYAMKQVKRDKPFSIREIPPVPEDPEARGKARRAARG